MRLLTALLALLLAPIPLLASDWPKTIAQAKKSVITITHTTKGGEMASCTAWYVAKHYVLTASHCFSEKWPALEPEHGFMRLVYLNGDTDLALLKVTKAGRPLRPAFSLSVGEEVAIMGFRGFDRYAFIGHVAAVNIEAFQTWPKGTLLSLHGLSGVSGGPVLNRHGLVVGVALGGGTALGSYPGIGYSASLESVMQALAYIPLGQRTFSQP